MRRKTYKPDPYEAFCRRMMRLTWISKGDHHATITQYMWGYRDAVKYVRQLAREADRKAK
jgi:cytochrome b